MKQINKGKEAMKLILKQCQVCGKTISKDNGNIETCICNICEERNKAESEKKALIAKGRTGKKSKANKTCKDMEKLARFVS